MTPSRRGTASGPSPDSSRQRRSSTKVRLEHLIRGVHPGTMIHSELAAIIEAEPGTPKGWWNYLTDLKRDGAIKVVGKVGVSNLYAWVPEEEREPIGEPEHPGAAQEEDRRRTRARKLLNQLTSVELRKEVRLLLREDRAYQKLMSLTENLIRNTEQSEIDKVEQELQQSRLRAQALTMRGLPWQGLVERLKAETRVLGQAWALLQDQMLPDPIVVKMLDRELDDLEQIIGLINERLARKRVGRGEIIDIDP